MNTRVGATMVSWRRRDRSTRACWITSARTPDDALSRSSGNWREGMMKIGTLAALPLALLASQALAHNWVKVGTDENEIPRYVDKDSIHRGDYNLVYFTDYYEPLDGPDGEDMAVDCPKRLIY